MEPRPAPADSDDKDVAELAAGQSQGKATQPVGRYRGVWDKLEKGQVRVGGELGWLAAVRSAADPNDENKDLIVFLPERQVSRLEARGIMPRLLAGEHPTVRVLLAPGSGPLPVPLVTGLDLE